MRKTKTGMKTLIFSFILFAFSPSLFAHPEDSLDRIEIKALDRTELKTFKEMDKTLKEARETLKGGTYWKEVGSLVEQAKTLDVTIDQVLKEVDYIFTQVSLILMDMDRIFADTDFFRRSDREVIMEQRHIIRSVDGVVVQAIGIINRVEALARNHNYYNHPVFLKGYGDKITKYTRQLYNYDRQFYEEEKHRRDGGVHRQNEEEPSAKDGGVRRQNEEALRQSEEMRRRDEER